MLSLHVPDLADPMLEDTNCQRLNSWSFMVHLLLLTWSLRKGVIKRLQWPVVYTFFSFVSTSVWVGVGISQQCPAARSCKLWSRLLIGGCYSCKASLLKEY